MPPADRFQEPETRKWDRLDHLIIDVPCHGCKYNLHGLPREGKCPECGMPLLESFHKFSSAPVQEHSEPPYEIVAGVMVISTRWFLTGISAILFLIASLLLTILNDSAVAVACAIILYLLTIILFLVGQTKGERRLGPRPKKETKERDHAPDDNGEEEKENDEEPQNQAE